MAAGCGGSPKTTGNSPNQPSAQHLVDPSGNWRMTFTDSNSQTFLLSALFNQVGAVVTGLSFSEEGNGQFASPPTPFACAAQTDISMANGIVQNVDQFSGTLSGNFGTIVFNSTLNDAGTHTTGTYTLTPGAAGDCLNIALTGIFTGDEIPSMSGTWTGTVTCVTNCPADTPLGAAGTISMTVTQDDATGAVNGTYTVTGMGTQLSGGTVTTDPVFDMLSGSSWQDHMTDKSNVPSGPSIGLFVIVGGPLNSFGTAGLGIDGSFNGNIIGGVGGNGVSEIKYAVTMHH
jgi:hypothetical protein